MRATQGIDRSAAQGHDLDVIVLAKLLTLEAVVHRLAGVREGADASGPRPSIELDHESPHYSPSLVACAIVLSSISSCRIQIVIICSRDSSSRRSTSATSSPPGSTAASCLATSTMLKNSERASVSGPARSTNRIGSNALRLPVPNWCCASSTAASMSENPIRSLTHRLTAGSGSSSPYRMCLPTWSPSRSNMLAQALCPRVRTWTSTRPAGKRSQTCTARYPLCGSRRMSLISARSTPKRLATSSANRVWSSSDPEISTRTPATS